MSGLYNSGPFLLSKHDIRIRAEFHESCFVDFKNGFETILESYTDDWWPRRGDMLGDAGDVNVLNQFKGPEDVEITRGRNSRFGLVGVTRDAYGSPLGSVTVRLYKTSDNSVLDTIVSDPSGNFTLSTPYYPDTHYIVAYKTGSPDVEGTTVNTLIAG